MLFTVTAVDWIHEKMQRYKNMTKEHLSTQKQLQYINLTIYLLQIQTVLLNIQRNWGEEKGGRPVEPQDLQSFLSLASTPQPLQPASHSGPTLVFCGWGSN